MQGSINKVGDKFQWNYQDDVTFKYGLCDTLEEAKAALEAAGKKEILTVEDFFNGPFMEWKAADLKLPTVKKYERLFRTYIKPSLGSLDITSVTSIQIETVLTDLIHNRNISPITVDVVKGIITGIFRRAFRTHLIPSNPCLDIELPKGRKKLKKKNPFTDSQLTEFLRRAEKTDYSLILDIMAWTGARLGEVVSLQWEDIDFEKENIRVRHTLEYIDGEFILNTPKTETSARNIPISVEHLKTIKQWGESKEYQSRLKLAEGKVVKTGNGVGKAEGETPLSNFVFISRRGLPVNETAVAYCMTRLVGGMKRDGLLDKDGHYSTHSLRYTFCSSCLSRGVPLRAVSDLLGHCSGKMVLEVYSRLTEEQRREELEKSGMLDRLNNIEPAV